MPVLTVRNHSFSNVDSIKTVHMHLDLEVDFRNRELRGKAVLDIENPHQCPYLILDTRQLIISRVLLEDSAETAWSLGPEKETFGQALVIQIEKNTRKVAVYYKTDPDAEALMWLKPEQTAGGKHPFLFTQSQAILARTWMPCMDLPSVRCTYTARIRCDKRYLALMSAENPSANNGQGVYEFRMEQPVPSYLMALAVGDISFRKIDDKCGVYAEPEMLEKAYNEFVSLPSMIGSAEKLYGKYEWGRYDLLVLPPSFPFGGMENPRLTFVTPTIISGDRSLVALVAHELAHSWSGNLVTNASWEDFWLNEGFTVYFEERIMEEVYGKDYADMLACISYWELQTTLKDFMISAPGDTKLKLNLTGRNPDDGVSDIAYVKGSLFLKYLEHLYGRKAWDIFLKSYFSAYKWKTITTEEFLEYLRQNLIEKYPGKNPDLKEWVYGIGLPESCPSIQSAQFVRVGSMADRLNTIKDPGSLDTAGFTTHHWLHLLRNLQPDSVQNLMGALDSMYGFSKSGNSEILCDWFLLSVRTGYQPAYPYLKQFLQSVGRRKFLKPLYEELSATDEGLKFAKEVYQEARESYHAVSRNTIEQILSIRKQ